MSIPATLSSAACPTLPSPRRRLSVTAPVRLLGAQVVWQVLWTARNPVKHPVAVPRARTAPQVDLRGRSEPVSSLELDRD
ncbi:hypothetical protein J2X46_000594 [Nocardioides sp. BE266]|uniref:hypothetical protein n=1 Tax=Nocardioides sp. BE266 TaxID=2817725 RepID=UPI002854C607|nr:hypothetical protein [Nocardioides sp. BE266]MDR7251622.1 hypothetical protein [Nocardioides sp. BE266]